MAHGRDVNRRKKTRDKKCEMRVTLETVFHICNCARSDCQLLRVYYFLPASPLLDTFLAPLFGFFRVLSPSTIPRRALGEGGDE